MYMWLSTLFSLLLGLVDTGKAENPHGCQTWSPAEVKCTSTLDINYIPLDLPSSIQRLDLRDNWIKELQRQPIERLEHLQYLDLTGNYIEYVENGTFASMVNLRTLNLSRCGLEDSHWLNITSYMPNLQILILSRNRLRHLDNRSFRGLLNLRFLDLASNALSIGECAFCRQQQLRRLHLRDNEITTLPNRLFHPQSELVSLDLSNNRLSDDVLEKEELWSGLERLQTLDVRLNYFSIPIFAQSFRNLTSLRTIDMSNDKIQQFCFRNVVPLLDLPIHVFILNNNPISLFEEYILLRLRHLRSLYLQQTFIPSSQLQKILPELQQTKIQNLHLGTAPGIVAIDNRTFGRLPGLEVVSIQGSGLAEVKPEVFRHSQNLTKLSLDRNNITVIDEHAFVGLESLEKLQLQLNNIKTLPNHVFDPLIALTYLDIRSNSLNSISPTTFQKLLNLRWLSLADNVIIQIDNSTFAGLSSLAYLDLSFNFLNTVKNVVVPSLKYLNLNGNKMGILQTNEFSGLANLLNLSVASNNIRTVEPRAFYALGKLQDLDLSDIRINTIKGRMFEGLENVTKLDLSSRKLLDKIEPYGFYGLRKLRQLKIDETIRAIPPYAFVGLDSLALLDLSFNYIVNVEKHAFDGLRNLKWLGLIKNKITVFEEGTFGRLVRRASRIRFEENPFYCDCKLLWFVEWARDNPDNIFLFHLQWYKCSAPPELAGTYLSDLQINCTLPTKTTFKPNLPLACTLSSSVILFYMLTAFLVNYYRWKIKYLMFLLRRRNEDEEPLRHRRFTYDAFVAHNSEDTRWVVHELCHNLENVNGRPKYRLCIHQRNFLPGAPIVDNIVKAIETSRKTICVLSRNFLRSGWCEFELQLAQTPDNLFGQGGSCRLILVFLERIPRPLLKKYRHLEAVLDRDTYLEWPGDERGRPLFWSRLRAALGKPMNAEQPRDRDNWDEERYELVPLLGV